MKVDKLTNYKSTKKKKEMKIDSWKLSKIKREKVKVD